MVPRVVFGQGCFKQLGEILLPKRRSSEVPFIFLVDDIFEGHILVNSIPLLFNDQIIFISAEEEPKTHQVDALVAQIKNSCRRYYRNYYYINHILVCGYHFFQQY